MKTKKPAIGVTGPVGPSCCPGGPTESVKPDCKAILGGMLCGLCMTCGVKDVREAVQWWSRNSKGWMHFAAFAAKEKAATK